MSVHMCPRCLASANEPSQTNHSSSLLCLDHLTTWSKLFLLIIILQFLIFTWSSGFQCLSSKLSSKCWGGVFNLPWGIQNFCFFTTYPHPPCLTGLELHLSCTWPVASFIFDWNHTSFYYLHHLSHPSSHFLLDCYSALLFVCILYIQGNSLSF